MKEENNEHALIQSADYYEIDWYYDGGNEPSTEKFRFIDDVKSALCIPLEMYDALLAAPYAVFLEDETITRLPFNPHEF